MRIGLDLDGVIIDHRENKRLLAREFGVELDRWQSNSNVIKRFVPPAAYGPFQDRLYAALTPKAPPVPDALAMIAAMPGEKFIVSARRPENVRFAQEWLTRHSFYDLIPAERVFFCGDEAEKKIICQRLGIGAFLDDKVSVLGLLPMSMHRFLFDEDEVAGRIEIPAGVRIVTTWSDFHGEMKMPSPR